MEPAGARQPYVVSLARDARSVLVHDCTKAKDGVWSLRLAAPGLEVCARAAPRAEGEAVSYTHLTLPTKA